MRIARDHRYEVPDRTVVRTWLENLAAGRVSPSDANDWAMEYVLFDDRQIYPQITDEVVWRGISWLCGADMMAGPDSPLYGRSDFVAWLDDYNLRCAKQPLRKTGDGQG
jgi:hypothetical protein